MLKTREQIEEYCEFDKPHLENEITTYFLGKSKARTGAVRDIQKSIEKEKNEVTKEKEEGEGYERTSKGVY